MAVSFSYSKQSIHSIDRKMQKGEDIVMELAINASTYMEPDKYFLLKASSNYEEIAAVLKMIEPETLDNCEIAYFNSDNELLGEFKIKDFIKYYPCDISLP